MLPAMIAVLDMPSLASSTPSIDAVKAAAVVTQTEVFENASDSDNASFQDPDISHLIISSPYIDEIHQLDLRSLSEPVANFAQALTHMDAVRPDYATAPYDRSFNWQAITSEYQQITQADLPREISFFVIVFRSRLKEGADRALLGELDKAAHLEAVESGGLLKYWFGTPDANRRNLATCLWRARDDARAGGAGPGHAAAMIAARRMYDEWFVERLRLSINLDKGSWSFSQWTDDL